ncbi:MAG: hypothetical protein PHC51_12860 [bacterium]|nr:hypothetical protein [bacterium]
MKLKYLLASSTVFLFAGCADLNSGPYSGGYDCSYYGTCGNSSPGYGTYPPPSYGSPYDRDYRYERERQLEREREHNARRERERWERENDRHRREEERERERERHDRDRERHHAVIAPPHIDNSIRPNCPSGTVFTGNTCRITDNKLRRPGGDGNINPCPKGMWVSGDRCVGK